MDHVSPYSRVFLQVFHTLFTGTVVRSRGPRVGGLSSIMALASVTGDPPIRGSVGSVAESDNCTSCISITSKQEDTPPGCFREQYYHYETCCQRRLERETGDRGANIYV